MSDKTYKMVEIVGTSGESFARAADGAVQKASKTLRNLDWFEVVEMRGAGRDGKIDQYQVTLKVGFRLD